MSWLNSRKDHSKSDDLNTVTTVDRGHKKLCQRGSMSITMWCKQGPAQVLIQSLHSFHSTIVHNLVRNDETSLRGFMSNSCLDFSCSTVMGFCWIFLEYYEQLIVNLDLWKQKELKEEFQATLLCDICSVSLERKINIKHNMPAELYWVTWANSKHYNVSSCKSIT